MPIAVEQIMERVAEQTRLRRSVAHIPVDACPFCERPAQLERTIGLWHASCTEFAHCGATGPIRETPESAAAAWNRRATTVGASP